MELGSRTRRATSGAARAVIRSATVSSPVIRSRSAMKFVSVYVSVVAIAPPSGLDRRIGAAAPLRPRAVVDRDAGVAQEVQPECEDRGGDPRAAGRRDRTREADTGGLESLAQVGCR